MIYYTLKIYMRNKFKFMGYSNLIKEVITLVLRVNYNNIQPRAQFCGHEFHNLFFFGNNKHENINQLSYMYNFFNWWFWAIFSQVKIIL